MSASGSGPLGLLLMIAPLAAIPVFAIVGVPQFAPVSASQSDEEEVVEWRDPVARTATAPSDSAPQGRSADDLFAPVVYSPSRTNAPAVRANPDSGGTHNRTGESARWLPPPEALDQWEVRPDTSQPAVKLKTPKKAAKSGTRTEPVHEPESAADADDDGLVSAEGFNPDLLKPGRSAKPARNVRPAEEAPVAQPSNQRKAAQPSRSIEAPPEVDASAEALGQAMAEQAGWQTAARRLKELGIRKYRLESKIEEQTFMFVCSFTSPENPNVVTRFEADADTPLEAVQLVLQQIDERRSRNGRGDEAESPADDDQ